MGQNPGQGRGGLAEQQESAVGFKTERQKVHTGKGAIVGQMVFEGEQVPGEATTELARTVAAAEREASDLIHRDRIPRHYHKAIRQYFSHMKNKSGQEPDSKELTPGAESADPPENAAPEPDPDKADQEP